MPKDHISKDHGLLTSHSTIGGVTSDSGGAYSGVFVYKDVALSNRIALPKSISW